MTEIQPDLRTVRVRILRKVVVNGRPEEPGTVHEISRADGSAGCTQLFLPIRSEAKRINFCEIYCNAKCDLSSDITWL